MQITVTSINKNRPPELPLRTVRRGVFGAAFFDLEREAVFPAGERLRVFPERLTVDLPVFLLAEAILSFFLDLMICLSIPKRRAFALQQTPF